ncbi:HAMP domain-containing histidine kinase (plasmid) [Mesorhizobium sp. AR02]|uniref:sensor histidine kinase n=1 Tax=Mesorhizobium sp. AR02 TaxID=2865837 RepID=UPI00215F281E|nr:HAMP domain-containing sensor histidine kinase [Mesorhizobium sp. AR02]UVK57534.1 HAMP domain-containing histidine kinase [Mesorhizobium sp. AR02]
MRRLYQHIYAALLLSLCVFAVLAGLLWRYVLGEVQTGNRVGIDTALAEVAMSASTAMPSDLATTLLQLQKRLGRADIAVFSPHGVSVASVGAPLPPPEHAKGRSFKERLTLDGWVWTFALSDGRVLVLRRPTDYDEPIPSVFLLLGATLIAVAIGAYPITRRLTRRLEGLKKAVDGFGAGDLSGRVDVSGKDEVAALADSFNRMAERIGELLSAHKTLLANASHELRSPLARLRMGAEMLQPRADKWLQQEFESNIAELDGLVGEILLASRLETLEIVTEMHPVDLLAITAEECAAADASLEGEPVTVFGEPRLLRRLVRNLLDNARRYGGGSAIEVSLARRGDAIRLSVCDRGPGVAVEERERIFEPFYRPVGTREQEGGVGLGLALVRQIARHHNGDVHCVARPGGGTSFEVELCDLKHADGHMPATTS